MFATLPHIPLLNPRPPSPPPPAATTPLRSCMKPSGTFEKHQFLRFCNTTPTTNTPRTSVGSTDSTESTTSTATNSSALTYVSWTVWDLDPSTVVPGVTPGRLCPRIQVFCFGKQVKFAELPPPHKKNKHFAARKAARKTATKRAANHYSAHAALGWLDSYSGDKCTGPASYGSYTIAGANVKVKRRLRLRSYYHWVVINIKYTLHEL